MRPRRARGLVLLALALVLGASAPARAWTRSVVKSAKATVDIRPDARMAVLLRLDVEVHAGWLRELELVGLGGEVELDRYRPPYFRSDEGEVFRPEAEVHEDGRIRLSFPRREAPRRGEYRVYIRYGTKAEVGAVGGEGERRARVTWHVPAWETGLHNVSVELRAPKGASIPPEMREAPAGVEVRVHERPDQTAVEWRRIHLPRMSDWRLALDVPAGAIALPPSAPQAPSPAGFRPFTFPKRRPVAWALFALAAVALLKRRSVELAMGRRQTLIRLPRPVVLGMTGLTLAVGQWFSPDYLLCAIPPVVLALHRPVRPSAPPESRIWHAVSANELPAATTTARELLDATTATGLFVLLCTGSVLLAFGHAGEALFLLPVFLSGTRFHLPPTTAECAQRLRGFAGELRIPADAPQIAFAWEMAADGAPRLVAHLPSHRTGLLSVSFVATSSVLGFLLPRKVMLLVETRAQSDADDLMRRRTATEPVIRGPNGSNQRLIKWDAEALELIRVLARKAPKPAKASRGTWLLREISETGCQAA